MHKLALLNGNIVDADEANIKASTAAALYGRSVFTTAAIYGGVPFLWEKHCRRLQDDSRKIGLDTTGIPFENIERLLHELIAANAVEAGRARITIFDESSTGLWTAKKNDGSCVLILTGDPRELSADLRLTFSTYSINSASPLAGIKSGNYLEPLLAREEAKKNGFDEAVRVNERNEITSACMANLFWLKDGRLFTPDLESGCLAGTTREFVLESVAFEESLVQKDVLLAAESIFISSAGVGIRRVRSLDKKVFEPLDHEILHLLPPLPSETVS